MTTQESLELTKDLLENLGLAEEPFVAFYADNKPEGAFSPKPGAPISRELEEQGKINMADIGKNFSCILGNIWLARKKRGSACISAEEYGCMGGGFFAGMYSPHLRMNECYVSTGLPGTPMLGERYMSSPEAMRTFLETLNPRKAPAKYCVFKPLSLCLEEEKPELVIFFARPEVLSGLCTLITFTTGDVQAVASPFGSGCTNILSWPLHYLARGEERAVLGGFDPSARKFMQTDELTLTVPWSLYIKMLNALPQSLLRVGDTWPGVRKKVARSATAWEKK